MWQGLGFFIASKLKLLFNPTNLVTGLLSKWYILFVIAAVGVVYWVFKGLDKAGVLTIIEKTVEGGFIDAKLVAQHCTPKILQLQDFWDCLQNPGKDGGYTPTTMEQELKESFKDLIKNDKEDSIPANPYW